MEGCFSRNSPPGSTPGVTGASPLCERPGRYPVAFRFSLRVGERLPFLRCVFERLWRKQLVPLPVTFLLFFLRRTLLSFHRPKLLFPADGSFWGFSPLLFRQPTGLFLFFFFDCDDRLSYLSFGGFSFPERGLVVLPASFHPAAQRVFLPPPRGDRFFIIDVPLFFWVIRPLSDPLDSPATLASFFFRVAFPSRRGCFSRYALSWIFYSARHPPLFRSTLIVYGY